ncbi:MAG: tape measure protein, partial [Moraxellaceae bacterium]|nr:tape measure protein [Moraxellaceae bacterium]MBS9780695.1 tape measure protein [Moraxellaceae bacterium]
MANSDLQAVLNIRAGVTGLSDIELLINTIEDAGGDVEQLRRQYQHLNNTWNTLSTEEQARQFGELRNQVVRTNNALSHSQNSTNQANTGLKDLRNTLMGFAGAYVGVDAVVSGIHELVETSKQLDSLNQKLEYATGSAEEAGETWEYLKNLANELGLEQIDLANGYAQLASATKNLNMSQEDTRLAFEGVANATAGMNLSADEANGVFLALSQIAGKGKVSMEELRGQLGERLTPAMGIASKAMGVTVQELEKMVESGINAKEFLPKFGLALTEAFGEQAQNNITTTTGKLNLLENKTTDLKEKLLDGFAGEGISSGIDLLTNGIDKISNAIDNIDPKTIEIVKETFEQFGEVARTSFTQLMTIISGIEENFQAINVAINGTTAQAEKFSLINSLILGVNVSLGAFNDGLKAIGIAFDLARGVSTQFFASIADNLSKVTFGDLSDKLKAYAVELNKASEESFERAKEKALGFKSSAVKAMEDYANASKQAMQEIEVDSSQATDKVVADLEKMANAGGQSAEDIRMKMADTAQSLGIDFELASDNLSRAMQGSSRDMQTLASNFDALKKQGYDASNLLIQSLTNMQDKVKNKADLQQLTNLWQQFGKEGKLSAQQVESGIDALNQKLSKQPQFLDETTKAFQQLGIISKVQAEKQAQAQMQAFELVKKSGQASSEQLQKALDNISKNIENSGNASLKTWAKSQQSATQTKETVKEVTTEYKNQVQAIQEVEQADNQATQSQQSNSNALLAMLERIME